MNNFLFRTLVRDWENTADPAVRDRYGRLAGFVGILSNALLCFMKIAVGIFSGSIAIIADGINNLADGASSVITLIGFKMSAKPEDQEHPYGHARYEYVAGLIVSFLIILVGFELLKSSLDKILHPAPLSFSWPVAAVLVLAILIKLWQAAFNRAAGKRIDSMTLLATAADSRNDVISTTAVLVSLLIGHFAQVNLDGWMGLAVALFIIWSGIGLVRDTISPLLGEAPDSELVQQIEQTAMSYSGVLGIHDLAVHNYGPGKIFASLHVEVDSVVDAMASHDLADSIEKRLREELHINITVHMDPVRVNDPNREPLKELLQQAIDAQPGFISFHDLRTVTGPTHTNVIFDVVVSQDCTLSEEEILRYFNQKLAEYDETFLASVEIDRCYITQNK
ncbi:MAG: cation transporter [Firmicutes bacterium]|nr:cation transporter [Bacillota bacterium]